MSKDSFLTPFILSPNFEIMCCDFDLLIIHYKSMLLLPQPFLPRHPQPLHLLPALPSQLLKSLPILSSHISEAPPGSDPANHVPLTHPSPQTPTFHRRPNDSLVPHPVADTAPFALPLPLLDIRELVLVGQCEPDGRTGPFVRGDGVPGRAEPAGYVEGQNAEVEGYQGEGDDGGGADAGVGDVDFWLGVGGRAVFIIGQADA